MAENEEKESKPKPWTEGGRVGDGTPGPGRKKGVPNKVTQEFRETVTKLLDDNRENVGRWLTLVAEGDGTDKVAPDPAKALDLLAKLAEYAAPKLARTELVGRDGEPFVLNLNRSKHAD